MPRIESTLYTMESSESRPKNALLTASQANTHEYIRYTRYSALARRRLSMDYTVSRPLERGWKSTEWKPPWCSPFRWNGRRKRQGSLLWWFASHLFFVEGALRTVCVCTYSNQSPCSKADSFDLDEY